MSPKPADPAVRKSLIETAARIVATEGRAGLTLRRLANEVGTSTMSVYTHFGSMDELRRAVRLEGFARFGSRQAAVRQTGEPLADLTLLGAAYFLSATSEPNLYRAMFLDGPVDDEDLTTGLDTFMHLVEAIRRCVEAGHFPKATSQDPAELAVEVWGLTHGLVSLQLAGLLPPDESVAHMRSAARSLFVAWGTEQGALRRADRAAARRSAELEVTSSPPRAS